MAAKTQSPASLSSRLNFGFGSRPEPSYRGASHSAEEDWYIPYTGPYEQPVPQPSHTRRDSWAEIFGIGVEGGSESGHQSVSAVGSLHREESKKSRVGRNRAFSSASRATTTGSSAGHGDPGRKSTSARSTNGRTNTYSNAPLPSVNNVDPSGGVGSVPMPAERIARKPSTRDLNTNGGGNRSSLASFISFGKGLLLSSPVDQLPQDRGATRSVTTRGRANTAGSMTPSVSAALSNAGPSTSRQRANDGQRREAAGYVDDQDHYSTPFAHQSTAIAATTTTTHTTTSNSQQQLHRFPQYSTPDYTSLRSHPYAVAFPSATTFARGAPQVLDAKGKGRLLDPHKLTITLLDSRGPHRVPDYLKPSPRTSLLKASLSTPNLRHLPKGKQKWLSAETWCDALILPRPRFALRLVDAGGGGGVDSPSGRIVSPPGSPVLPSEAKIITRENSNVDSNRASPKKVVKKASSISNLVSGLSHKDGVGGVKEHEIVAPTPVVATSAAAAVVGAPSNNRRPPRPTSWALDDLALPSPVPSLAKVLEDGKQLEEERKAWKSAASQSFQNKRARSISRVRSKSVGAQQAKARGLRPAADATAFEFLAERSLLGNQVRPPTIHVHGPPRSKSSRENLHTTSGRTLSSAYTHTHTHTFSHTGSNSVSRTQSRGKSHAHSNSLGTSTSHKSLSTESSGHSRNQSVGKSALKLVNGAAALCGFGPIEETSAEPTPTVEKPDIIEGALMAPTKVIRLQDQARQDDRVRFRETDVVVITPPHALTATNGGPVGNSGVNGSSPAPSGLTVSAEGIGIAISSPPHSDHSHQYEPREPIILPVPHPYGQTTAYSYSQPTKLQIPEHPASSTEPSPISPADSVTRRRQPVLVHPYAQPGHPYANPGQSRPSPQPRIESPTDNNRLYAELSPGYIREIDPNDIQYSPFSAKFPHRREDSSISAVVAAAPGHPYGRTVNRFSELGFGDALVRTLRDRGSMDSGLGTDETEGRSSTPPRVERADSGNRRVEKPDVPPSSEGHGSHQHQQHHILVEENTDNRGMFYAEPESQEGYFDQKRVRARNTSFGTVSQDVSPSDSTPPSRVRRQASTGTGLSVRLGRSSGSSPGMISHDSSPPVSPRPINIGSTEDLERFRDLFYKPTENREIIRDNRAQSASPRKGLESRQDSGSIVIDVSSHSSRSVVSGLTNLARQLSEDIEEMNQEAQRHHQAGRDSPMWGARLAGGLRAGQQRQEDLSDDPNVALSQVSSDAGSPPGQTLPLRLPTPGPFTQPVANFPEDIGPEELESSRASSILDGSQYIEDMQDDLRFGEIEAVTTPPAIPSPERHSTQCFIGYQKHNSLGTAASEMAPPPRVVSQGSTLPTPLSPDAARSSYMTSGTDTSRMSGLSDFPVPPTHHFPLPQPSRSSEHLSIPDPHVRSSPSPTHLDVPRTRPSFSRELSQDTFGARGEFSVGEAL